MQHKLVIAFFVVSSMGLHTEEAVYPPCSVCSHWLNVVVTVVGAWTFGTQLSLSCRCNPHRPSSSEFLLLLTSQQGHTFLPGTEQPLHRGSMTLLRRLTSYVSLSKQQLDTTGVTSCIVVWWIRSSRP